MTLSQDLLHELRLEAEVTRRFLERVPFDQADFRPHVLSEPLGRLAIHVAEIIAWWRECIVNNSLDFIDFEPKDIRSSDELLRYFDELLHEAEAALLNARDEDFHALWSMKHGEDILFTLPKKQVLRHFCLHHLVHHRAQLGLYLRLLGVQVPATYGPSADDEDVIMITPYRI